MNSVFTQDLLTLLRGKMREAAFQSQNNKFKTYFLTAVADMIVEDESNALGPSVISKQAITSGEWEVMGRKIWVCYCVFYTCSYVFCVYFVN